MNSLQNALNLIIILFLLWISEGTRGGKIESRDKENEAEQLAQNSPSLFQPEEQNTKQPENGESFGIGQQIQAPNHPPQNVQSQNASSAQLIPFNKQTDQSHSPPSHISFSELRNVLSEIIFRQTSKWNLFWTAYLPKKCPVYEFNGTFGMLRMNQLRDIVKHGGSIQSNDTLEYEEYIFLLNWEHIEDPFVSAFLVQVAKLDKAIGHFYTQNSNYFKNENMPSMNLLANGLASNKNVLKLLIECKLFMYNQMVEGAPGTWLHFPSFMRNSNYEKLKAIHECSTLQSAKLDESINEAILNEHRENQPTESSHQEGQQRRLFKRTIVEGAGPIGLYSAFKFFMAGSNVLCVNERDNYTRNRAIFLDQRWMHQLRFLLGTEFDKLFIDALASGRISVAEYVGQISINQLEMSLKRRLQSLEKYMDRRYGKGQNILNLRFGQKLVVISKPKLSRTENQLFHHAEMESKTGEKVKPMNTAVEFLVCAGGANDRIRDAYIGLPRELSETNYYGVAVFVIRQPRVPIFADLNVAFMTESNKLVPHLRDYQFDQFFAQHGHLFSEEFRTYYEKFTDQMELEEELIKIRLYESKVTVNIFTKTPEMAEEFFEDLTKEERQAAEHERTQIKHFRQIIEQKWAAALFRLSMAHAGIEMPPVDEKLLRSNLPDGRVEFDEEPVNTANFPLTIRGVDDAVGIIMDENVNENNKFNADHHSMEAVKTIAIAVGDANTTPHFATTSGLSTGRMGAERAAQILRQYHVGILSTEETLIDELRKGLNSIRARVLDKIALNLPKVLLYS